MTMTVNGRKDVWSRINPIPLKAKGFFAETGAGERTKGKSATKFIKKCNHEMEVAVHGQTYLYNDKMYSALLYSASEPIAI